MSHPNNQHEIPNDVCEKCGKTFQELWNKPQACMSFVQPCCNKPGFDVWNYGISQWECGTCGAAKSNDPAYLSSKLGNTASYPSVGEMIAEASGWGRSHGSNSKLGCQHEYVSYTGLKEQFDYCKKCDARK